MASVETHTVPLTVVSRVARALAMLCGTATCALALVACKAQHHGPRLQVVSESYRAPRGAPLPETSPFLHGDRVELTGARGEVLAIQVLSRDEAAPAIKLAIEGTDVHGFALAPATVKRPSTGMYGGSLGAGTYLDEIVPAAEPKQEAYFEIAIANTASSGAHLGELAIGSRRIPVTLAVSSVELPPVDKTPWIWAYEDPREFAWSGFATESSVAAPSSDETRCIAMFRSFGIVLSPDLPPTAWNARKSLLEGFPYVPALLPDDVATLGAAVRAWIANTTGTSQIPFAIPVDEPRTPAARAKVRALAEATRATGSGHFMFAVTDEPRPEYGDAVDLFITLKPHLTDRVSRWTYNGAPPHAGSMVLDAPAPGPRTWGFIAWRWHIPVWYVWDALYWHDRHNRKGAPLPGRALSHEDAVTFDDGEDHGNRDGVLAVPGDAEQPCRPTLRLAAIRRAVQDRALLDVASRCAPEATAKLAASLVPRALGDAADHGSTAWPSEDQPWDAAHRKLLELAEPCVPK
ncbi:MAG: hypothetical protein JWO36_5963 [Myxococcales bacterium]|nr:hypothetical protein [Myxococcales bacterium]